jgi:hypothetical protein
VPEEFFDLRKDPHCMNNLIDHRKYQQQIDAFRLRMAKHLKSSEDPMAEVFDVYQESHSVDRLVETYAAMWDKHGIPGRVASNPVDMSRWDDSAGPEEEKTKPTDEARKANRAARRAAEKAKQK